MSSGTQDAARRTRPAERPAATQAAFFAGKRRALAEFSEAGAAARARWFRRHRYFYRQVARFFRRRIPPGARVLELGCRDGFLLDALRPAVGVGLDPSPALVRQARARYPHLVFECRHAHEAAALGQVFDYVILGTAADELVDLVELFRALRSCTHEGTRVFVMNRNPLWHPLLKLAGTLGFVREPPHRNWLHRRALGDILALAGYQEVARGALLLVPLALPIVSGVANRVLARLPGGRGLCLLQYTVARPRVRNRRAADYRVTVVVPCKNEEGNVPQIVDRVPDMGAGTEIVFVDDRSTDGTRAAMEAARVAHPERRIVIVPGPGRGKGAAVRAGLACATGDCYAILDADMTVMPEALPGFFRALVEDHGEFINGTRLVYPLEDDSMRTANIVGNKLFALAFSFLLDQPISDTLCGTKMLWARDYPKILAARRHFGGVDRWGDYDWIFGAARHALAIAEYPVHYVARTAGQTKMTKRLHNALVMLRMCGIALRRIKLR